MKLLKNPTIFHIDMDAFYASVEQADDPRLKGKCVVIGGKSHRSVVSAASYEARRFGVRSAMPMVRALKMCPDAVVLPVRMTRYKTISRQIMALLATFSPQVEQVSVDEAFLDATGCGLLFSDERKLAGAIKTRIYESFGLTCSVGIAPARFLAKIASDMDKPDGLTLIAPEAVDGFIRTLPIEKVSGVGGKTHELLTQLGVRFLGDVRKVPEKVLKQVLGKQGLRLMAFSRGRDKAVVSGRDVKSVSSEETFLSDTKDMELLAACLLKHAEDVGRVLRAKSRKAKVISIKIKYDDFSQITRSRALASASFSTETIYRAALKILKENQPEKPVRLVGVAATRLFPADHLLQRSLFETDKNSENWEKVDHVLDAISEKFGDGMVRKAGLQRARPDKEHKSRPTNGLSE